MLFQITNIKFVCHLFHFDNFIACNWNVLQKKAKQANKWLNANTSYHSGWLLLHLLIVIGEIWFLFMCLTAKPTVKTNSYLMICFFEIVSFFFVVAFNWCVMYPPFWHFRMAPDCCNYHHLGCHLYFMSFLCA